MAEDAVKVRIVIEAPLAGQADKLFLAGIQISDQRQHHQLEGLIKDPPGRQLLLASFSLAAAGKEPQQHIFQTAFLLLSPQQAAAIVLHDVGNMNSPGHDEQRKVFFLAESDDKKALLLVISSTGSTPVRSGSLMAMDYLGNGYGTIGGGCSEAGVMAKARKIIREGGSCVVDIDMTNEVAESEGMVCGGTMRVLVEAM